MLSQTAKQPAQQPVQYGQTQNVKHPGRAGEDTISSKILTHAICGQMQKPPGSLTQSVLQHEMTKHRGLRLFITVETDEMPGPQVDGPTKKSLVLSDYEIDLDPTWTIKRLQQKVRDDMMQINFSLKDPTLIESMKIYALDNGDITTLDLTKTCNEQNVKSNAQLIFTRATVDSMSVERYSLSSRGLIHGMYGQGMGSPTQKPGGIKPGTLPGINKQGGIQVGINQRLPSISDQANNLKRQGSKTATTPRNKEVDEHGNPIKRSKSKRTPKPVEEATLYYRIAQRDEQTDLDDAGYPSPEQSDQEGQDKEGENQAEAAEGEKEQQKPEEGALPAPDKIKTNGNHGLKPKIEKVFDRSIKVGTKTRLKEIRKTILEQIGVEDICTARIFKITNGVNVKPFEESKGAQNPEDERELMKGDLASVETLGLMDGSRLEVEIFFTIDVSVDGMGKTYRQALEVSPEERMDTILSRVGFCRMFQQRGFQLYSPDLDRQFEAMELTSILFRDSNLKNNSKLVLRRPPVDAADEDSEMEMDEGFEGGEDELEDMDEQGEEEIDEPGEEGAAEEGGDPDAAEGDKNEEVKDAEAQGEEVPATQQEGQAIAAEQAAGGDAAAGTEACNDNKTQDNK